MRNAEERTCSAFVLIAIRLHHERYLQGVKACRHALQVCQLANYLKSIGVKRGSDVTIYMPMVPELPAAMVSLVLQSLECYMSHLIIRDRLHAWLAQGTENGWIIWDCT